MASTVPVVAHLMSLAAHIDRIEGIRVELAALLIEVDQGCGRRVLEDNAAAEDTAAGELRAERILVELGDIQVALVILWDQLRNKYRRLYGIRNR